MTTTETEQTKGIDETNMRGNGSGEPTSTLTDAQQNAYQGLTQQEIDAFISCANARSAPEPRVVIKGGASSLVPKLLGMHFNPSDALEYATRIAGVDETVEGVVKASTKAALGKEEPRFDYHSGRLLQPEAILYQKED